MCLNSAESALLVPVVCYSSPQLHKNDISARGPLPPPPHLEFDKTRLPNPLKLLREHRWRGGQALRDIVCVVERGGGEW
jgi:hypothetical protein